MSHYPSTLPELHLGKTVNYADHYDPSLLQRVSRQLGRDTLNLKKESDLPFVGEDIWTGYELSWLNPRGKPYVAILECRIPYQSPYLIESKSFKLYLNSFNQTQITNERALIQRLEHDLSDCAQAEVKVKLIALNNDEHLAIRRFEGICIDDQDIDINQYRPNQNLLKTTSQQVSETLYSNLLKSNCLITRQPDWGSVQIAYEGPAIEQAGLLRYIVSFRQHDEFHEQCVERMFIDIMQRCRPTKLSIYARYTRRGGMEINPFRTNFQSAPANTRLIRQ
jgi:7-cyano-7-deazaguanine reductase